MLVKAEQLGRVYTQFGVATTALQDVNLSVQEGEFVCIMGPSGCGKTTLLNLLGLLDSPTSGQLYFRGEEVAKAHSSYRAQLRRLYIGFVFQNFNLIDELTIAENVELPLIYLGESAQARTQKVNRILEELNLAHKRRYFPQQLSGGQQQRVAVARALVAEPLLILADEPTGNLDSASGQTVMEMLLALNERGTTVIMVTHSNLAADYANRIVNLFDGQIVNESVSTLAR